MELFKLRYNLYKYFIKNDFNFKNTINSLNIFKNLLYIIIIFFILIFIIGFEYINYYIIFFITILIIFIYNIEKILIKLDEIINNKPFQLYYNYYKTLNKIFNINYDNINDIDGIINSPSTVNTGSITKIELTFGGLGYTPENEYTITITQPEAQAGATQATAKVRALRNGSLSGEIYDLDSGSGITNLNITPIIKISGIEANVISKATFKYYISKKLSMSNIKEYSLSYMNVYENIKRKIEYIDNILIEDIEEHIHSIKKENDLLKYIDIYDKKYDFLKKFMIINQDKNEELYKIFREYTDIIEQVNSNTILINLENLEKYKKNDDIKEIYSKFMNKLELKDLNFIENPNLNHNEKILKYIEKFDIIFNNLLILIIIIFTIILHIFFINLY